MKKILLLAIFAAQAALAAGKFKLEDFSIRLEKVLSAPNHIWVNSGYTTVNPKNLSVMGVNDFFSPPFGTKGFNFLVSLKADSIMIPDGPDYGKGDVGLLYSAGTWYPDKISRTGTYHHFKGNLLYSFSVKSELIPLFGKSGFMEKITVTNRSDHSVNLNLNIALNPGELLNEPLSKWGYSLFRWTAPAANSEGNNIWQNEKTKITLFKQAEAANLKQNQTHTFYTAVIIADYNDKFPDSFDFEANERETTSAWEKRIEKYTQNIPLLESNIPAMKEFYNRSILSGLVCIWENKKFKLNPHVSTSGMDGGATCSYLWDVAGYNPKVLTLMLGDDILNIARQMAKIDLEKYYAFTLDGSGIGVKYAYSPAAFTSLVAAVFQFLKPDKELYYDARELILSDEKREDKKTNLIDYGVQHNLLEMRGTGWEHIVVSPNAERIWCLSQLSQMGEIVGENNSLIEEWKFKAGLIKESIRKNLWDDNKKWFASVYPNGFKDFVYSIQAFDVLPTGVCTAEMEKALLSNLRDGAFLSKYGVSSVSAEDTVHYEVVDTDWSGGGAYLGDGLQLASFLYESNNKELAWKILKRYFWMGESFIYYPQEIYVDKPGSPAHKRANVISGLNGAEALLFGLFGFNAEKEGSLFINPHPVNEGSISIKGFCYKGNTVDVNLSINELKIFKNGKLIYSGKPKRVKII